MLVVDESRSCNRFGHSFATRASLRWPLNPGLTIGSNDPKEQCPYTQFTSNGRASPVLVNRAWLTRLSCTVYGRTWVSGFKTLLLLPLLDPRSGRDFRAVLIRLIPQWWFYVLPSRQDGCPRWRNITPWTVCLFSVVGLLFQCKNSLS